MLLSCYLETWFQGLVLGIFYLMMHLHYSDHFFIWIGLKCSFMSFFLVPGSSYYLLNTWGHMGSKVVHKNNVGVSTLFLYALTGCKFIKLFFIQWTRQIRAIKYLSQLHQRPQIFTLRWSWSLLRTLMKLQLWCLAYLLWTGTPWFKFLHSKVAYHRQLLLCCFLSNPPSLPV